MLTMTFVMSPVCTQVAGYACQIDVSPEGRLVTRCIVVLYFNRSELLKW